MKKILINAVVFLIVIFLAGECLAKMEIPGRTKNYVNDYAGVLDNYTRDYLEKLSQFVNKRSGKDNVELIISIFPTLDGWWLEEFAPIYGEKWRAAKRYQRDNGVILLVVVDTKQNVIGVGRNLTSVISQKLLGDITRDKLGKNIEKGDYALGIKSAAQDIANILDGAAIPRDNIMDLLKRIGIILLVLAGLALVIILVIKNKQAK